MNDQANLSGLARAEIDALEADGIILTAEEVVRINALAWNVEMPEVRKSLSRGVPVFVGGVTLWPMTIYGGDWIERTRFPKKFRTVALAYAMHKGRDEGGLDIDGREAVKAVSAWLKRLRCTKKELHAAMAQIIQQDEGYDLPPSIGTSKTLDKGEFISLLSSLAGGTPEFWERRVSSSYAFSMLSTVMRQNAADGIGSNKDDTLRAERCLGWYLDRVRKSRKGAGNVAND